MVSKKIAALLAAGLLVATTSAAAQTVPAAALLQAVEVEDDTGTNSGVLIGVGFALAAFGALLAFGGDSDGDEDPVSA